MNKKLMEALYNNIVKDNLELYKTFFESDSDEEGVIDYWEKAIKFYSNLSLADQDLLFSIIKSTIIDTISNMFAIADGGEIIGNYSIEIKINNEIAEDLQDDFLAYIEDNNLVDD